jgi:hypothetical protein
MSSDITPFDGFTDDRLLALALGLGDDPELQTALAASPALAERLTKMSADVSAITDRLQAAAPPDDPGYADPAAARWQRLHASFAPTSISSARSGRRRIGRLATIAAAVALFAVAVGVAVQQMPGGSVQTTATESAPSADDRIPAPEPADKGTFGENYDGGLIVLPRAEHFKTVVVARAGEVVDDLQDFAVERVLKGRMGDTLSLLIRDGVAALPVGSLDVLYLRPLSELNWPANLSEQKTAAGGAAISTVNPAVMPTPAPGYAMGGLDAYVQPVPEGVDVSALTVP